MKSCTVQSGPKKFENLRAVCKENRIFMVFTECDKLYSFIRQINYILLRAFSKIVNSDLYLYGTFREVTQHSQHFFQVSLEQVNSEGFPISLFLQTEIVTNHCQPPPFPSPYPYSCVIYFLSLSCAFDCRRFGVF